MAAPTFQAAGTFQSGGAVVLTVPWPAHITDDVAILEVSSGGAIGDPTTAAGFVELPDSPRSTTGLAKRWFWCRATSNAMASVVLATGSNNIEAVITTYRGCAATGDPWDVTSGNDKTVTSTATSITGDTTTGPDRLIYYSTARGSDAAANQYSGEADSTVTGLAEHVDNGTITGNGGGIGVWTGTKATAGAYGPMTATLAGTSLECCNSLALLPLSTAVTGTVAVTLDAFTSTASGTVANPITGTSAQTLGAFTSAATGSVNITGTSAQTLGDFTSTASGTVANPISGASAVTLSDFTSNATGTLGISGTAAVTLGDFVSTATGVETISGTSATTLGDFTANASGIVAQAVIGTAAVTLGDFTSAASGTSSVLITGSAAVTLGDLVSTASGNVVVNISGTAAVTLQNFTCMAIGTAGVQPIILPPLVTIRDADPRPGVGDADPQVRVKTGNREAVLVRRVRGGTIS